MFFEKEKIDEIITSTNKDTYKETIHYKDT